MSGVVCNCKSLHGMAGTASYSHSTNNLQTESVEEICGGCDGSSEEGCEQELTEHLNRIDATGSI